MKAEVKYYHSPDVENLELYEPDERDNFCFLLQVMAGPEGVNGEESFDITICTPKWLINNINSKIIIGRHYLIVPSYDWKQIKELIENYTKEHEGKDWKECAERLSRLGHWEFEDYQE